MEKWNGNFEQIRNQIEKRISRPSDLEYVEYGKTWKEFCDEGLNFPGIYVVVSKMLHGKHVGFYFYLLGLVNLCGSGDDGDYEDGISRDDIVDRFTVACFIGELDRK